MVESKRGNKFTWSPHSLFSHAITFTKDMGEGCHNPFLGHPKSFFLFFKKKKKKTARCRFERHCAAFLPCKCRDKGEEDFWNLFPAHPLLLYLPTCLTTYTTHTLINGETGDPCPPPWRKAEDPCPDHHALCLYRVWWTSPPLPINTRGGGAEWGG